MNKVAIKIVKKGVGKTQVVIKASRDERDVQLMMVNVVGNWISERRENSRVEKVFSDSKISAWKIMSEDYKKTTS